MIIGYKERESLGEIKHCYDFMTQWLQYIFMVLVKILVAVNVKHSSFWASDDDKPMSKDLMHAVPRQCLFALSVCLYYDLYESFTPRLVPQA